MVSPKLVAPLASVIGWPMDRLTNVTGRLARENAVRNPSRTAVTAAALMVGLALVGFVTIFAAELKKSVDDAVSREFAGTYAIYNQTQNTIPAAAASSVARVPGVRLVSATKSDVGRISGAGDTNFTAVQPATFTQVYRFQWKHGSNASVFRMGPYDAVMTDAFASDHQFSVGSRVLVTTTTGKRDTFTVTGIFKSAQFLGSLVVPYGTFRRDWGLAGDSVDYVLNEPGQNLAVVKKRIDALLTARYPAATANSESDYKNQVSMSVNQILYLIYVLLALSVLVSLFGIINTLVLSIYERTREIGMLRAIGTTRGQVRWIIRWESVITAVIGAVLGLLLGIVLAAVVTAGSSSQGIEFTLPIGQLLLWVVFAMLFGIVAAAWPARRAARLDVLLAVAYE
jgi:putative ABC transport system permease protein